MAAGDTVVYRTVQRAGLIICRITASRKQYSGHYSQLLLEERENIISSSMMVVERHTGGSSFQPIWHVLHVVIQFKIHTRYPTLGSI